MRPMNNRKIPQNNIYSLLFKKFITKCEILRILISILLNLLLVSSVEAGDQSQDFHDQKTTSLAIAAENGITVIDAQKLVDANGNRVHSAPKSQWEVLVPSSNLADWSSNYEPIYDKKVTIIHIHGFDTRPHEAIASSKTLFKLVKTATKSLRADGVTKLSWEEFHPILFLWRGHFVIIGNRYIDKLTFSRAQRVAEISSEALLDLSGFLRATNPNTKIIVVAHSLGAKVALEALSHSCIEEGNQFLWESLVLVQGAVHAVSLHNWEVRDLYNNPSYSEKNSGQYAAALRCVRQLIVTCTPKDTVLSSAFELDETWINDRRYTGTLPTLPQGLSSDPKTGVHAIGICFDRSDKSQIIPKIRPAHLERIEKLLKGEKLIPKYSVSLPYREHEAFLVFSDWRVNHPHFHELDISHGHFSDGGDWHSPLQDTRGQYIVDSIWRYLIPIVEP